MLDTPVYVGAHILGLSKARLYHLIYDKPLPILRIPNQTKQNPIVRIIYIDTDGFSLSIANLPDDQFYHRQNLLSEIFDFSDLPTDYPSYTTKHSAITGILKDEAKGKKIRSFIALSAKCYTYTFKSGEEIKKSKGLPAKARKFISPSNYRENLSAFNKIFSGMYAINLTTTQRIRYNTINNSKRRRQ